MTRKIVIAHYKENLDWCLNIKDKYDIKIYSKTNNNYNFLDNNKGNEVPMYLKYIIDNYNDLPDRTMFLHGHNNSWHQDYESKYIIENINWGTRDFFSVNKRSLYQEISKKYTLNENKNAFDDWIRKNWNIFQDKLIFPEDGLFFYTGAQFVVSKKLILQYDIIFWKKLFDWVTSTNINNAITSRIFEYTWHYIFTKNRIEEKISKILK